MPMPPMGGRMPNYQRPKPPASIKDLPRYLKEVLGGFFKRFFYILKLVWNTGHWIPVLLAFVALFKGVTPVVGSLISQRILNGLQSVIQTGPQPESTFWTSGVLYLLIAFFIYRLLILVVNNVSNALNRIAGERWLWKLKIRLCTSLRKLILPLSTMLHFMKKWRMRSGKQDTDRCIFLRKLWVLSVL